MFKFRSTRLLNNLQELRNRFSGNSLSATVRVPPELAWWYYQEFGTAENLEGGNPEYNVAPSTKPSGYSIYPTEANGILLPATPEHPVPIILPFVGEPMTRNNPGVAATHFVESALENIRVLAAGKLAAALHDGGYELEYVRATLIEQIMPDVIDEIATSMGQSLNQRREDGKLNGQSPESVFKELASVQETSE